MHNDEPRKESSAVAAILPCSACLHVSLPIRLHGILLRTLLAFVLLLSVLAGEMLFYACKVPERTSRVVMEAAWLRTDVDFLLDFRAASLSELPRQIMSSPVQLQVLVSLKSFVAYFANKSVGCQKRPRRKSDDFGIRICHRRNESAQRRVMSIRSFLQSHRR